MLDRDVLVLEPAGLAVGRVEQPREPLGDVHLPGRHAGPADPRAAAELGLQVLAQPVRIGSRPGEQRRDQALRLVEQCQQQVLPVHLDVAEAQRLGLGVVQSLLRLLGQSVHVHGAPPRRDIRRCVFSSSAIRSSSSTTSPMAE